MHVCIHSSMCMHSHTTQLCSYVALHPGMYMYQYVYNHIAINHDPDFGTTTKCNFSYVVAISFKYKFLKFSNLKVIKV